MKLNLIDLEFYSNTINNFEKYYFKYTHSVIYLGNINFYIELYDYTHHHILSFEILILMDNIYRIQSNFIDDCLSILFPYIDNIYYQYIQYLKENL